MPFEGLAIADVVNGVVNAIEFVANWARPPLRIEVLSFSFQDLTGAGVVTSYPRRYLVGLKLTNRSTRVVYIETIVAAIRGDTTPLKAALGEPLRLLPGEPREERVVFPLTEGEAPMGEGSFRLDVRPTVGKHAVAGGRFPLK